MFDTGLEPVVTPSNVPTIANRWLLRRVARPVVALLGVSLVDATFWLVDPSGIGLHYRAESGPVDRVRALAIVMRAALVGAMVWTGETALTATCGGRIQKELERVHNQRQRASITDHTVICGYGTFGRTVAEGRRSDGVVVIEHDAGQYEHALDDEGVLGTEGDARREGILRKAGTDRADTLVAAIDDSNPNVRIALLASQLEPDLTIVVRVGDRTHEELARHASADEVVIPEVAGGERVRTAVTGSGRPRHRDLGAQSPCSTGAW